MVNERIRLQFWCHSCLSLILCLWMKGLRMSMRTDLCPDVTAVLLAGGRSSRMGLDKALLTVGGTPLVQLLSERLAEVTREVLLSANDPSAYDFLHLTIVADVFPGCGPLAGLHAAMLHSRRSWILALACDLPRISSTLLKSLIRHTQGVDAVVPVTSGGLLQPVCAAYSRAFIPAIERNLRAGENRMIRLLEEPHMRIKRLTPTEGSFSDADLLDIDDPRDLEEFLRLYKS